MFFFLGFGRYRCGVDKGRIILVIGDLDWLYDYSFSLRLMKEDDGYLYNK